MWKILFQIELRFSRKFQENFTLPTFILPLLRTIMGTQLCPENFVSFLLEQRVLQAQITININATFKIKSEVHCCTPCIALIHNPYNHWKKPLWDVIKSKN